MYSRKWDHTLTGDVRKNWHHSVIACVFPFVASVSTHFRTLDLTCANRDLSIGSCQAQITHQLQSLPEVSDEFLAIAALRFQQLLYIHSRLQSSDFFKISHEMHLNRPVLVDELMHVKEDRSYVLHLRLPLGRIGRISQCRGEVEKGKHSTPQQILQVLSPIIVRQRQL